jgi:hypothetical protein
MRRVASIVLLVVAGVLFPVSVIVGWADSTLYDSRNFSERAVEPLNSEAVRRELSRRLTGQLVRAGNRQATEFRPAFELGLEAVIDTDTFRSIFRNAVRRTHEAIIEQEGEGRRGLDLGASFAVITSGLRAGSDGGDGTQPAESGSASGLDNSLSDVTRRVDDLGLWNAEGIVGEVALASFLGALAAAVGSILLAADRRRAVRRLGFAAVIGGLFVVALLVAAGWFVGREIEDADLAAALKGALGEVTSDLRLSGFWIAAYGLVIAAAAVSGERRYTPAEVWTRARGWVQRRRKTRAGTVLLGVLGLVISIVFVQEPLGNLELLIIAAALWVGYLAITELLRLVRAIPAAGERRALWRRLAPAGVAIVVIAGLVTAGFALTRRGTAQAAEAVDEHECNTQESLCDLRIDEVAFPGVHHAFASSEYRGYLFAQQQGRITDQLNAGVRALNIDTHYGVESTARFPGQDTPIILTDRVATAEMRARVEEDPVAEKRAAQLAASAPRAVNAERRIYMCHSNCETGAIPFTDGLDEIKRFLDTHPDDVLLLTIHDFTIPADTAAVIAEAGLADRAATLRPGAPLPTLRELIESGRTLLVFAERGDPGGPPWYHSMYDEWFQETTFAFTDKDQFDCAANRGPADAPMFLINHWLTLSPPNPTLEGTMNTRAVLEKRIEQCLAERGLVPNIVQVQFAERGDLFATVEALNERRLEEQPEKANATQPAEPPPDPGTPASPDVGQAAPLPESTVITTLTGGDPVRFCPALPAAERSAHAWAVAILHAEPVDAGLTDFAFAPLLVRDLRAYVEAAPQELVARADPILQRARDAVASLRALGLRDRDIKRLGSTASDALSGPDSPNSLRVRATLVAALEKKVDPERLRQAAVEFSTAHGDATALLDLGFVPPEVAAAAGYSCAAPT